MPLLIIGAIHVNAGILVRPAKMMCHRSGFAVSLPRRCLFVELPRLRVGWSGEAARRVTWLLTESAGVGDRRKHLIVQSPEENQHSSQSLARQKQAAYPVNLHFRDATQSSALDIGSSAKASDWYIMARKNVAIRTRRIPVHSWNLNLCHMPTQAVSGHPSIYCRLAKPCSDIA